MPNEMEKPPMPEEGDDGRESAMVPTSMFGGDCKVGDRYTVEVVGKYDDELAIEHVPDSEKKEAEDDSMEGAMNRMDKMGGPSSPASNEGY